jgi:hypothetical protein
MPQRFFLWKLSNVVVPNWLKIHCVLKTEKTRTGAVLRNVFNYKCIYVLLNWLQSFFSPFPLPFFSRQFFSNLFFLPLLLTISAQAQLYFEQYVPRARCLWMKTGLPDGMCVFKPKIPIWVNFGGSSNGRCCYILCTFGLHILWTFDILCGLLVYLVVIWYIFPQLVCCTKMNLATLLGNEWKNFFTAIKPLLIKSQTHEKKKTFFIAANRQQKRFLVLVLEPRLSCQNERSLWIIFLLVHM